MADQMASAKEAARKNQIEQSEPSVESAVENSEVALNIEERQLERETEDARLVEEKLQEIASLVELPEEKQSEESSDTTQQTGDFTIRQLGEEKAPVQQ